MSSSFAHDNHPIYDVFGAGLACGNQKASVPWGKLLENPADYINPKYLLADSTLKEPSKLTKSEAHDHLKFWYDRQEDPSCKVPFMFKAFRSTKDGSAVAVAMGPKANNRESRKQPRAETSESEGEQDEDEKEEEHDDEVPDELPSKRKVIRVLPFAAIHKTVGLASWLVSKWG